MTDSKFVEEVKNYVFSMDIRSVEFANLFVKELACESSIADRKTRNFVVDTIKEKQLRSGVNTLDSPLFLMWKITKRCNLNCQHCWADLKGKERTTQELLDAVERFADLGVVSISISGGEPFLRNDIFAIIKAIKKKRIILEVMTNGTLLNEDYVDKLADLLSLRDDVVQISLDGASEEVVVKQRNKPLFNQVLSAIERLKDRGVKVRITFTATPFNIYSIIDAYRVVDEFGVEIFSVAPVFPLRKGLELDKDMNEELYLSSVLICKLLEKNNQTMFRWFLTRKLVPQLILNSDIKNELSWPEEDDLLLYVHETNISAVIDSIGCLYPSADLSVKPLSAGNIYEEDLGELWNIGRNWHEFRHGRDLRKTKCRYCRCFQLCQGGSQARSFLAKGTIHAPDPTCTLSIKE